MKAHVWVMPKRTVLDPQGQAIQHALSRWDSAVFATSARANFFVLDLDGRLSGSRRKADRTRGARGPDEPVIEEFATKSSISGP